MNIKIEQKEDGNEHITKITKIYNPCESPTPVIRQPPTDYLFGQQRCPCRVPLRSAGHTGGDLIDVRAGQR